MLENQYQLFRDLDRRCVAGGLRSDECQGAVKLKRASIESERFRTNPIVQEVLAGKTTFVAVYGTHSHAFRGLRRFVPVTHDEEWNIRLAHFGQIVPNVKHFMRRSVFALDNPVSCTLYGLVAAAGVALVLAHATREDEEAISNDPFSNSDPMAGQSFALMFTLFAVVGFMAGVFAMLRYRTRDSRIIHAREAAAYMDLNYGYYRLGDDAAWARFIHSQGTAGQPVAKTGHSTQE